ncbi:putative bifunctional diguanylate cyclase/phosphodiesterase [Aureimonas leprariae]|uniref:EAL domain-containing protein n=1 Tax=Plantimonas leprariae TaxID=2615207 RepID=A0A7V7PLE1_9HYPH|nr:EAL domain-containing protein [Aureimonas leprariae]KAB0677074.1 EAL domain-containing protein [Aureimonas leprariae]
MMDWLFVLGLQHSFEAVAAAASICALGGWLVTSLVREVEVASGSRRHWWFAGLTVVAGVAVWTTHFVAMLGYRPDAFLIYDAATTAVSAAVAVAAVGLPLALAMRARHHRVRVALGLAAGAGIAAMHMSGMEALEGCVRTHSAGSTVLSAAVGAAFLGFYAGFAPGRIGRTAGTVLFVLAVCGAHFTSLAGTRIHPLLANDGSGDNLILSLASMAGTLLLFAAAATVLLATRRFHAQEKAHAIVLSTALDNMSNGLVYFDPAGRLQLFNRRYVEIFGIDAGRLRTGMTPAEVIDAIGRTKNWSAERRSLARARAGEWMSAADFTTFDYPMDDGRIMEVEIRPVAAGGSVLTFDDVTRSRQAQTRIEELAFKDPLTGLANRRALAQRMEADIGSSRRFELLLIDLDRFKSVNDSHGHGVGDKLLVKVAERIGGVVSRGAFVARLGGDEMAVLVYGDHDIARSVADGVVLMLARPFAIGDLTVSIGCSVGLCRSEDAADAEQLMQRTDIALYEAKRQGRGRAVAYQPGMLEVVTERHRLEDDLREAIETQAFHLAYQPVVDLKTGEPLGYEALIRWTHPVRGAVSPVAFVPLAEENGQIVAIGRWVLMEACRAAAAWPNGRHVAVNVSPVQLRSPLFLSHVTAALAESGLAPCRLEVELTETAMVESGTQIADALGALRILGIRIAMDDFGTGYSSLAHLRDFPLDRIKIDRSFVAAAETDRHSMAVLRAVTQIGRDIGIPTLAEGVETPSQWELLKALGCDAGQGYLFGRPERLDTAAAATAPLAAAG